MFVNNAPLGVVLGMFKINSDGAGNGESHYFMWYKGFSVNHWISWRIQNLSAARAITITDFKVLIEKVPEN